MLRNESYNTYMMILGHAIYLMKVLYFGIWWHIVRETRKKRNSKVVVGLQLSLPAQSWAVGY